MPDNLAALTEALRASLGRDAVLDAAAAAERPTSYWNPAPMQAALLVRPRDTADVSTVLRACHAHRVPVVTHGGLSGCVEGVIADRHSVVLSMERLRAVEEIDPVGATVTVQAGVTLQALQEAVREHRLYFPVDLGARGTCTVGGNAATNAGGINVIRYGMMRARVLGLEAVLADGTVVDSMNRMLKNNAGYDLKQLFIGSEGTLGVITRLVLRLDEQPLSRCTAMLSLASFEAVAALLKHARRRLGGQLCAYEVMWGEYYRAVTVPDAHRPPLAREQPFYVLMETEGAQPEADAAVFEAALAEALEQGLAQDAVIAQSSAERATLWAVREDFSALYRTPPIFLYDVSLPIRHMEAYARDVLQRLRRRWPRGFCQIMGHMGDGNLHLFVHPGEAGEDQHAQSDADVYGALAPFGGSVSAEHGIGLEKRHWLGLSRSAPEIALMRTLKQALDPHNLLNPGKVLPPTSDACPPTLRT